MRVKQALISFVLTVTLAPSAQAQGGVTAERVQSALRRLEILGLFVGFAVLGPYWTAHHHFFLNVCSPKVWERRSDMCIR